MCIRDRYAIIPHRGKWDKASIADDSDCWNEPLLHSCYPVAKPESKSFIDLQNTGYQVSALQMKDGKVLLRLDVYKRQRLGSVKVVKTF